jgi:uncharacterized protein (DUF1697 family)
MGTVRIALPRAVNLGPHKKVPMAGLRVLAAELGLEDPRTILNSGNLLFRSRLSPAKLEDLLESGSAERLGLDTEFFVRTAAEWAKIVAANPFTQAAKTDPGHLMVHLCKRPPGKALKVSGQNREKVKPIGREIYVTYPDGIGRSKLKLDVLTTARNWNTVLKLSALAGG